MRFLQAWHSYFKNNRLSQGNISWEAEDDVISSEEAILIGKSIAAFQLGEYSEGRGLLKAAEEYSRNLGDDLLFEITQLFVKEEQNHALLLKRFMRSHGIPLLKKHWTDTVFRGLRKYFSYESSVTVLITAEIIALVYYKALKNCTGSKVLDSICDKILMDERAHVTYESEMIRYMRGQKSRAYRLTIRLLHRFLFLGTVLVVYFDHRKVFGKGGYGFIRFWKSCWSEFSTCFSLERKLVLKRFFKLPPDNSI
ncbi:MAG TPA: ferritin-like domain-containing protein [Pyrinomonadaceae bacterium]